jgi:hypothetical protein
MRPVPASENEQCPMLERVAEQPRNTGPCSGADAQAQEGQNGTQQSSGIPPPNLKLIEDARKRRLQRAISIVAIILVTMSFFMVGIMLALHSNINYGTYVHKLATASRCEFVVTNERKHNTLLRFRCIVGIAAARHLNMTSRLLWLNQSRFII